MQRKVLRIFSVLFAVAILSAAVIPASALSAGFDVSDFFGFSYGAYFSWKSSHPDAPDSAYPGFNPGGIFGGGVGREGLEDRYNDYVSTFPATGYKSNGRIIWNSYEGKSEGIVIYCPSSLTGSLITDRVELPYTYSSASKYYIYNLMSDNSGIIYEYGSSNSSMVPGFYAYYTTIAPISGTYYLITEPYCIISGLDSKGFSFESSKKRGSSAKIYSAGDSFTTPGVNEFFESANLRSFTFYYYFAHYEIVPDGASTGDTYHQNTRAGSITGGSYGIIGDDGQLTVVNDNSTIINETNNTFYNPATGQTETITDWSYDYTDRSYDVTLEDGSKAKITYGDENITIQEGDTIYNIYYVVEGEGSGGDTHTHDWRETQVINATCTEDGKKIYTCAICEDNKIETIFGSALGHDWFVKETVSAQYGEDGVLIQEGYTLYECSRCHEQYKSTDTSVGPPSSGGDTGGGSGSDSSDSEESGGFLGWLLGKIGDLLGTIFGGALNLLKSILEKIFDALIALLEMLMDKLTVVVETILSLFEVIPTLFSGFLAFLAAVFPFFPPELMTILTFGVVAIVVIGIIKAVRR